MKFFFIFFLLTPSMSWARTPTVNEVQQEALRASGYDRSEMGDWKEKARWAAALPRLQVGFDRDLRDVVKLATRDNVSIAGGDVTIGPDENDFDKNFQQGFGFEVKAVWALDELLFSRDRLEVSRETRSWLEDRSRLLERVTQLYFDWKRAPSPIQRERFEGQLDAYTSGWFSEALAR